MSKWNRENITARKCTVISDILDTVGVKGVAGKTVEELFDFAERVVYDDSFWAEVPEVISPNNADIEEVKEIIGDAYLFFSFDGDDEETIKKTLLQDFVGGQKRDDLRGELRSILVDCRS